MAVNEVTVSDVSESEAAWTEAPEPLISAMAVDANVSTTSTLSACSPRSVGAVKAYWTLALIVTSPAGVASDPIEPSTTTSATRVDGEPALA